MYAIIDKRVSLEVKRNLRKYVDDIFEFSSEGITYNSISGHPDIFLFQDEKGLVVAPNSPKELLTFLTDKKVNYCLGNNPIGDKLDDSVFYNCLSTNKYFFCKDGKPDIVIQERCASKIIIDLPQSYTRCSMFSINDKIITSDKGIVKVLEKNNIKHFYFDPSEISISDHKYGFIGGTMGMNENRVFFLGDILKHKDGDALNQFITDQGKEVICLGTKHLYDGGSVFFVE